MHCIVLWRLKTMRGAIPPPHAVPRWDRLASPFCRDAPLSVVLLDRQKYFSVVCQTFRHEKNLQQWLQILENCCGQTTYSMSSCSTVSNALNNTRNTRTTKAITSNPIVFPLLQKFEVSLKKHRSIWNSSTSSEIHANRFLHVGLRGK
jgi:hypothetical protein